MTKRENGTEIEFTETPYYFTVTVNKRTWYWRKNTGEIDGTSKQVTKDSTNKA